MLYVDSLLSEDEIQTGCFSLKLMNNLCRNKEKATTIRRTKQFLLVVAVDHWMRPCWWGGLEVGGCWGAGRR